MMQAKKSTFYILFLLISFASVGAMVFTPGMPAIKVFFHLSTSKAQLTYMAYLLGYALGELPYGPISNRYGYKKAVYLGASIALIGSIICLLASHLFHYWLLLLGLFITGLGGAVGLGLALAFVSIDYPEQQVTKITSYLIPSFAIMPAIAVVLSGFSIHHFGWQSAFYLYAVYSIIIFFLAARLPDSKNLQHNALQLKNIFRVYFNIFTNIKFVIAAIILAGSTCFIYFYGALAPFIGISIIGLPSDQYGLLSLLPYAGIVCGALFGGKAAQYISSFMATWIGLLISTIGIVIMLISFEHSMINIFTLFIPSCTLFFGAAFIFANASSTAMSFVVDKANASAVMNFINMFIPFCGALIFSLINSKATLIFPIATLIIAIIIAISNIIIYKIKHYE